MQVLKRNGMVVPFEEQKIENAIAKAFFATKEVEPSNVKAIAKAITLMVISNIKEDGIETPSVEQIQDYVEIKLIKCDYAKTAKDYILYRKQHQKARQVKNQCYSVKPNFDKIGVRLFFLSKN